MNTAGAGERFITTDALAIPWRVSSHSASAGGNCVEVGPSHGQSRRVAVRHSHHPTGAAFLYGPDEWSGFIDAVKHGDFDFST